MVDYRDLEAIRAVAETLAMPRPRVDMVVHLRLSDDASGVPPERDALFRLDEAIDNRFGEQYDGNDMGQGGIPSSLGPNGRS